MPHKSATDKKIEEKAEIQANPEEIPPSETSEMKSENSTLEAAENPIEATNKKLFDGKWIFVILVLILIALFFIYFDNIQNLFLNYESRFYVGGGLFIALMVGLLVWYVPKQQVKKLESKQSGDKLTEFEREQKRLKLEDDTRKTLAQIIGGVFLIAGLFVTYNTYRLGMNNYSLSLKQQEISIQKQDPDWVRKTDSCETSQKI